MKHWIKEMYKSIPECPRELEVLVTYDLLPVERNEPYGVKGYRISFVNIKEGLLRWANYEKRFKPAPSLLEYMGNKNRVDTLYVSEEGLELIDQLGYNWFRQDIFEPERWSEKKIGEGSESRVFKANLAGKECVVKLPNYEGIDHMNETIGKMFRISYFVPNYLSKFGVTKKISQLLKEINKLKPFKTFQIEESPIEYVAGANFIIEEYTEAENLFEIKESIKNNGNSKVNDLDKNELKKIISEFEKEIKELDDLFFMLGYEKTGSKKKHIGNRTDFALYNWMWKEFDFENKKFRLSLIDQAPEKHGGDDASIMAEIGEKMRRYEKLSEKLKNDWLFKKLESVAI